MTTKVLNTKMFYTLQHKALDCRKLQISNITAPCLSAVGIFLVWFWFWFVVSHMELSRCADELYALGTLGLRLPRVFLFANLYSCIVNVRNKEVHVE